jgi:hypothetical protein
VRVSTNENGYLQLGKVNSQYRRESNWGEQNYLTVLYPTKATRSSFLAAGEYTLQDLGVSRNHAKVYGYGEAKIVAIWSRDSLPLSGLTRYGHWIVSDLRIDELADPAAATLALLERHGDVVNPVTAGVEVRYSAPERLLVTRRLKTNFESMEDVTREQYRRLERECPAGSARANGGGEVCVAQ